MNLREKCTENKIIIGDIRSNKKNYSYKKKNSDSHKTGGECQNDACDDDDISEKIKAIVNKYKILCKKQMNHYREKQINKVNLLESKNKYLSDIKYKYASREKNSFKNQNMYDNRKIQKDSGINERICYSDKTTYCRPIINYNQEFIYRTIEQNTKLKHAVHKLIKTREKEKENISWDNYINNLKSKHGLSHNSLQISRTQCQERNNSKKADDYYTIKFCKSQPCQDFFRNLYRTYNPSQNYVGQRDGVDSEVNSEDNYKFRTFDKISYCYPTSSQGRLIVLNRERQRHGKDSNKRNYNSTWWHKDDNLTLSKNFRYNNTPRINKVFKNKSINRIKSIFIQTDDLHFRTLSIQNNLCCRYKDKAVLTNAVYKNTNKLPHNIQNQRHLVKSKSVNSIESKLDTLIMSINSFIEEIKLNRLTLTENSNVTPYNCFNTIDDKKCNKQHDKNNTIMRKTFENNSLSCNKYLCDYNKPNEEKIEHIFNINNNKFNHVTTNNNKNELREESSVQITFEIPTKDCCTEITKSLSKQVLFSDKSVHYTKEDKTQENNDINSMHIAVNTDPLSFLALLKIFSDTLKHLLSFVPNIDYYSYLSKLNQFHALFLNREGRCDCYSKERNQNLGQHPIYSRNCCNCKNIYDKAFEVTGPFKCTFCGMSFTRAYCWELHHISCAKRFGKQHDNSSLMLLS